MNQPQRQYRYYEFVMAAFVTILICSNLIGPAKICQMDLPLVGIVTFGAGVLFSRYPMCSATYLPRSMVTPRPVA